MMNLRNVLVLIVATQLVSAGLTAAVFVYGWSYQLDQEQVESIGGTMTLLLLGVGIFAHLQAKKGTIVPAMIAVLGLFGPTYACLGGPVRHVLGYHAVSLGVCAFVAWNYKKRELAKRNTDG
jgi:hypothetical protein